MLLFFNHYMHFTTGQAKQSIKQIPSPQRLYHLPKSTLPYTQVSHVQGIRIKPFFSFVFDWRKQKLNFWKVSRLDATFLLCFIFNWEVFFSEIWYSKFKTTGKNLPVLANLSSLSGKSPWNSQNLPTQRRTLNTLLVVQDSFESNLITKTKNFFLNTLSLQLLFAPTLWQTKAEPRSGPCSCLYKDDSKKNLFHLLDVNSGFPFKFIIFGIEGPYMSASSKPTSFVCVRNNKKKVSTYENVCSYEFLVEQNFKTVYFLFKLQVGHEI